MLARRRRGLYIWVVGPDGCGKSTLATAFARQADGLHRYWRPALLPMPRELLGNPELPGVNSRPHDHALNSPARGIARLLYYAIDYVVGYLRVFRPALLEGRDVVVERGWYDMAVDPRRYRLGSARGVRLLGALIRAPDVLVVVSVQPHTARARKPELPVNEIERQYQAWRAMRLPARVHRIQLDNEQHPAAVLAELEETLVQLRCV